MNILKKALKKAIPRKYRPENITCRVIKEKTNSKVFSGPFVGMDYVGLSVGSEYCPKLLGTYESELHSTIEELCQKAFDAIINVGAAEGYYAVGMAMRNPGSRVIAFEITSSGQKLITRMAESNGVKDRLDILGLCTVSRLSRSVSQKNKCLIIMDAEGSEGILLDEVLIPQLAKAFLLIEVHDFISSEIGGLIIERFKNTHRINEIWSKEKSMADFPAELLKKMSFMPKKLLVSSMNELRPSKMRWLYLQPNHQ